MMLSDPFEQNPAVAPSQPVRPFFMSVEIDKLAAALAKAQGEIRAAAKDSINPHFKNRYADLAACWDACREPLSKNGLAVVQLPRAEGRKVTLVYALLHSSGQYIGSDLALTAMKDDPQGAGGAITYSRRYTLAALVGLSQDDDDGNAASGVKLPGKSDGSAPQYVDPARNRFAEKKQEERDAPTYTGTDAQKRELFADLKQRRVEESLMKAVHEKMIGKKILYNNVSDAIGAARLQTGIPHPTKEERETLRDGGA